MTKIVDPWTWPKARRNAVWSYVLGQYLGGTDEIPDGAPRKLLPLDRFDDLRLHRLTSYVTEDEADRRAGSMTRKGCAGRRREVTSTGPELRRAIRAGTFTGIERETFEWTLSGIWPEHRWTLVAWWRLSIYELARINAREYDGKLAISAWLNLWGADPSRPLPDGDGLCRAERARRRGFEMKADRLCDATTGEPIELTPGPWSRTTIPST